jgi:hypothetical protein
MSENGMRLVREWRKHGRLIIALDFDDTVYPYSRKDDHDLRVYANTIELVVACKEAGAHVIVWTASNPSRYQFMRDYLAERGLVVDGINENVPGLPFGNHGKIYANVYIDDRAGMQEALGDLRAALQRHTDPLYL